jgi:hypothetical protein
MNRTTQCNPPYEPAHLHVLSNAVTAKSAHKIVQKIEGDRNYDIIAKDRHRWTR